MQCPVFSTSNLYSKIDLVDECCHQALLTQYDPIIGAPIRDQPTSDPRLHPIKKGLSEKKGQARLLHDLANIELQAMELGLRTLIDFPHAQSDFKYRLIEVIKDEANHLKLCLQGLEHLGFQWGDWPIHNNLWNATSPDDTLLERITIVHRFLEGSGLDASSKIIHRLESIDSPIIYNALTTIVHEEVPHVKFGSEWFQSICHKEKKDSEIEFEVTLNKLYSKLPVRLEKICTSLRLEAGFTLKEIDSLVNFQKRQRAKTRKLNYYFL